MGSGSERILTELVGKIQRTFRLRGALESLFRVEVPVEEADAVDVIRAELRQRRIIGLAPGQLEYRILIMEDERPIVSYYSACSKTPDSWYVGRE